MKNVIKYVGIVLVIAGILLVMKNLFTQDEEWNTTTKKKTTEETTEVTYYSAKIELLDEESSSYLSGSNLVLKKENGEIIEKWTTDGGVHLVNKLEKGTYVIEQESAPDGYHLNEEGVTFEIKNKDKDVVMYNTKMTEEEIEEARLQNTTSSEVAGVDNTLSEKNIWSILGGVISIGVGIGLILLQKKSSSNDV